MNKNDDLIGVYSNRELSLMACEGNVKAAIKLAERKPELKLLLNPMIASAKSGNTKVILELLHVTAAILAEKHPVVEPPPKEIKREITLLSVLESLAVDVIRASPLLRSPFEPRPEITHAIGVISEAFDGKKTKTTDVNVPVKAEQGTDDGDMRLKPMLAAAENGQVEAIRMLLPISDILSNDCAPLRAAAREGHVEAFKELANHVGDISVITEKYSDLFKPEIAELLIPSLNFNKSLTSKRSNFKNTDTSKQNKNSF